MADKDIPPYRCTYCLQAIPEDHEQDLFATYRRRPKSDDAHNFVSETQTILHYASAVAAMLIAAEKESEDIHYQLQMLVGELTDEATRRLERAHDALEIVWQREEAAKKATHACKEGRA
jgi:hypothetical protein